MACLVEKAKEKKRQCMFVVCPSVRRQMKYKCTVIRKKKEGELKQDSTEDKNRRGDDVLKRQAMSLSLYGLSTRSIILTCTLALQVRSR